MPPIMHIHFHHERIVRGSAEVIPEEDPIIGPLSQIKSDILGNSCSKGHKQVDALVLGSHTERCPLIEKKRSFLNNNWFLSFVRFLIGWLGSSTQLCHIKLVGGTS